MRVPTLLTATAVLFATVIGAWDPQDHEIFRIRDDLSALESPTISFYDFLGVTPAATQQDIAKAQRARSRKMHPDKARQAFIDTYGASGETPDAKKSKNKKPGVKVRRRPTEREIENYVAKATERYQLLTVVADILKGEGRARYDHFMKNGFPKWRGTGWYYERYRPGLGTVLVGLFVFGGGLVHYGILILSWKRQCEFVDRYIKHARRTAWGNDMGLAIPGLGNANANGRVGSTTPPSNGEDGDDQQAQPRNRKERRAMERESKGGKSRKAVAIAAKRSGATGAVQDAEMISGPAPTKKKRVVAENGKVLIVDSVGNVYLEDETPEGSKTEYLLDPNEIPKPTPFDTAVCRLPMWMYNKTIGRLVGKRPLDELAADEHDEYAVDDAVQAALALNSNGEARRRKPKMRQRRE